MELEVYDWRGTLTEFIQQHPSGKFFTIIELTGEEEVSKQKTHAVAVVDGASYNISDSDMNRPIFKVWKVKFIQDQLG